VFISIKVPGGLSLVVLGIAYAIGIGFFSAVHFLNLWVLKRRPAGTLPAE
jgi:hypothetical protein